ncbi:hypothetical protein ASA1KI_37340 [Opitutales bacterium ASA1]|nr:hypothetical protein ASA1KI_37340 [Opitutales bacterium ASA1]
MEFDWQTWVAPVIVVVSATLLARAAWKRRNRHEGCGCPGAIGGREAEDLKRRLRRADRAERSRRAS